MNIVHRSLFLLELVIIQKWNGDNVKKASPPNFSLAPLNPEFSKSIKQGIKSEIKPSGKGLGFKPHPLKLNHLVKAQAHLKLTAQAIPSKYDLRKQGRVSPVEDQGPAGTCWAFASYGSMESCLLPEEKWDFSENNMVNLLSENCPEGYDREPDGGGNELMSTAYLARWSGPVSEAKDPYNPGGNPECRQFEPLKHIKRVLYLPDRKNANDNGTIKKAIMDYGAVFTTIYFEESAYQKDNYTYYYKGSETANHSICLVGWDDNFNRKKFSSRPPKNGAFIAQNSWGTNWGDRGFFYISYYDTQVGNYNALFNRSDPPNDFNSIFQYDPLGWVTSVGYGPDEAWMANMYRTEKTIKIGAVSWYAASPGSSYEMYIYQNPDSANPRSGQLLLSIKGNIESASYFTRLVNPSPNISAGQSFSLVLKLKTPEFNYPIPVQMPIEGYSSKAKSSPGQSFISTDGEKWDDISLIWENSSVCLKALANS